MSRDIEFKIIKHIGVLSEDSRGFTKELNIISWNGKPPKFDIRSWDSEHKKMTRGITLDSDEAAELAALILDSEI